MNGINVRGLNQFCTANLTNAPAWCAHHIAGGQRFNPKSVKVRCSTNLFANQKRPLGGIHEHHERDGVGSRRKSMGAAREQDHRYVPHRFFAGRVLTGSKHTQLKRFLDSGAGGVNNIVGGIGGAADEDHRRTAFHRHHGPLSGDFR